MVDQFGTKNSDDLIDRKSSTMSSMFIGSTISKPNVDSIINAVATILHSQMLEVSETTLSLSESEPEQIDSLGQRPLLLL